MITITPTMREKFSKYECNYGDVVIRNVPAPINAFNILLDMGLNVSPKIVVMEFDSRYLRYGAYGSMEKEKFISSYQYLEMGTENDRIQNNVATYNPEMETLTIHIRSLSEIVGRGHDKNLCKKWLDASFFRVIH